MKACTVENCTRKHAARGFCDYHYRRHKDGRSLTPPDEIRDVKQPPRNVGVCSFIGCGRRHAVAGFCSSHYAQLRTQRKTGRPLTPIKTERKYPPLCTFDGCTRPTHACGLCSTHNRQRLQGLPLTPVVRGKPCTVPGCGKEHVGRGYCKVHYNIWKAYQINPAHYDRMYAEQGGVCAVCGEKCQRHGERLSVDHDHATGEVRGLLCVLCNLSIGGFLDRPDLMRRAADYIEQSAARRIAPGHEAPERRAPAPPPQGARLYKSRGARSC